MELPLHQDTKIMMHRKLLGIYGREWYDRNTKIKYADIKTVQEIQNMENVKHGLFFGHVDNKKLVVPDTIEIKFYGTILATIKQCKRCQNCFFQTRQSQENVKN